MQNKRAIGVAVCALLAAAITMGCQESSHEDRSAPLAQRPLETTEKESDVMTQNHSHPLEKLVQTITYKDVEFEVVERPDVLWVGCVDYAANNTDESDIFATLKRFQGLVGENGAPNDLVNPGWNASLSINYSCKDKPRGVMHANETYSDKQDQRYDLFTQPGGLWLRVRNDKTAAALLGKESAESWEYFGGVLQTVAKENGYVQNPDVHVQVEYYCHAEFNTPSVTNYAYIPIVRVK